MMSPTQSSFVSSVHEAHKRDSSPNAENVSTRTASSTSSPMPPTKTVFLVLVPSSISTVRREARARFLDRAATRFLTRQGASEGAVLPTSIPVTVRLACTEVGGPWTLPLIWLPCLVNYHLRQCSTDLPARGHRIGHFPQCTLYLQGSVHIEAGARPLQSSRAPCAARAGRPQCEILYSIRNPRR